MMEGLTIHKEWQLCLKVSKGESADMAGVLPLIRDLCDLDDQRRVLGGLDAFKLHTIGPRSER